MNRPPDSCETAGVREPLEIERLVSKSARRVTPDDQLHFRRCISTDERGVDEIDRALDEEDDDFDPCLLDRPPGRRSGREISRLDDIFKELGRGTHEAIH